MSETTEVKGQFGLGQSGGTGKKLKIIIFLQMFKYPTKNNKRQELKLMNSFITSHDLTCECNHPAFHVLQVITKQLAKELTTEEKNQIKKCLGDGTDHVTGEEDTTPDIGEDLEKLFEGDFTEEDTG